MNKLLVTGANGFIGSHLVDFLIKNTDNEILLVDNQQNIRAKYFPNLQRLTYITSENFYNHIEQFKDLSGIFHLGAISSTTEKDWGKINLYNIYLSRIVISFAKENNIHLVFASSASLYGHNISFKTSNTGKISSLYAYSKLVIDQLIENEFNRLPTIKLSCLRLFNVYGSNEAHKNDQSSPFFKFINQAKKHREILLFDNSGDYLRDFISVEDVVLIMYKIYQSEIFGVYNLGTGKAYSFQTIAEKIAIQYQAEIKWTEMPKNLKKHYQAYTKADIESLKKRIGDYTFQEI